MSSLEFSLCHGPELKKGSRGPTATCEPHPAPASEGGAGTTDKVCKH